MAFCRILLSFSSCVQFKIMWLIMCSSFSLQGHVEVGIILNLWRYDLVKPWPITIAVNSAEIDNMVFILVLYMGRIIYLLLSCVCACAHVCTCVCAFSGIFFCQVWKDVTDVFSLCIVTLFEWNHSCSSFVSLQFCFGEHVNFLLLLECLCHLQITLLVFGYLLGGYLLKQYWTNNWLLMHAMFHFALGGNIYFLF
jgi:hypothetical protein